MTIRRLTVSDAENVQKIEQACFSLPWSLTSITHAFEAGWLFFGAFQGDEMMGFVGANEIGGEFFLGNLAVLPDFRRLGAGRALMEAMLAHAAAERFSFVTLEVRSQNTAAITLYESLLFQRQGLRPRFYEHPQDDAILMTRFFS